MLRSNMTEDEKILYGFGDTNKIVAVQQVSSQLMRLYIREGEQVTFIDRKFYPFFFVSDYSLLDSFEGKVWKKRLQGDAFYNCICVFENWSDMLRALKIIAQKLNQTKSSFYDLKEVYTRFEPVTQFLLQSGETLFKNLTYEDVKILAIKILVVNGGQSEFHSKFKEQVYAIALTDNTGWNEIIYQKPNAIFEKDVLLKFVEIIKEKDPDILVGYNLTEEFANLIIRYEFNGVSFEIGRDNSEPLLNLNNKILIGNKRIPDVIISGRHFVDLLPMVSHSDNVKREVEDFSQQNVMRYFGIRETEEFSMSESKFTYFVDRDPEIVIRKMQLDVKEILELTNILLPQHFYQAHFVPLNLVQIIRTGVSHKIELMLIREYLRRRHSLPAPGISEPIIGGYTNVFYRGVFKNIIHADVDSLYPSIIIKNKIYPVSDKLGVFLKLVTILTKERLKLKRLKEKSKDPVKSKHYDMIQSSYKILINSFYGYLGYFKAIFNDYQKANEVTTRGQAILKNLIKEFQKRGCTVIEVDTDGLYFAPEKELTEDEEKQLVEDVNKTLPDEINLSFGGRYSRMLSYKKKNYALLTYDNKLIIKGSALISRSFENYILNFMRDCIEFIITDRLDLIPKIYTGLKDEIQNLKININDLARTEILNDTYEEYDKAVKSGRRQRGAAYEIAYKYYGNKFYPGMKVSYYITGDDPNVKIYENCELVEFFNPNFPNVNKAYYLKKLEEYVARFEVFFTKEDFNLLFPKEGMLIFDVKPRVINSLIKEVD